MKEVLANEQAAEEIKDELREIRSALTDVSNSIDNLIIAFLATGDAYKSRLHEEAQDRIEFRNHRDTY